MAWPIVVLFPVILFLTGYMLAAYDPHTYDSHPNGKYMGQFGMNLSFFHLSDAQWDELKKLSKRYYFIATSLSIVETGIVILACRNTIGLAMTLIVFFGMVLELLTLAILVRKVKKQQETID